MAKRPTQLPVERTKPTAERVEIFDGPGSIPGLGLRVTPRGVKSFCLLVRVNGKQRRVTAVA